MIANGIVNGNNAYVSGSQTNESLYGEVVAPVFKSLELDGSARYDHFDSGAAKWTPKLGFKWTPSETFALRGTIGKGFRAPNPAENGQSGQAYLVNTIADPILCPGGIPSSGNIAAGSVVSTCNFQPVYLNSANPSLKPETSTASTLGVIFEPIKGWSSTFDLYQVEIRNQIVAGSPDITQAVRSAPVSTLCADGNGGTVTCTPSTGQILYIPVEYVNANSTKTSGIEFDTNYRFNLGDYGKLRADLQWTHIMSYILKIDGVNYGLAGTHGPLVIGGDTANPRDRIQATLTWDRGPWEVAGTVNYISSYNLTDPSFGADDCAAGATIAGWFPSSAPPSQYCKVSSFVDTDVSVHYAYDKHLTIFGSVTNLFNKQPPVDIGTYGGGLLPYNPSMHYAGAIGRFVNAGATYKF